MQSIPLWQPLAAEARAPHLLVEKPPVPRPLPITASIGLSQRVVTVLANAGIDTFAQLARLSDSTLLQIPNLGYAALCEIRETLQQLGFARQEAPGAPAIEHRRTALERELWDLTMPAGGAVERGIAMVHFGWDGRLSIEEIRDRYRVRRDLLRSIFLAVETQPPPTPKSVRAIRIAARFIASHAPLWIEDAQQLLSTAALSRQRITIHGMLEACRIGGLEPPFSLASTPRRLVVTADAGDCRVVVRTLQHLTAVRGTATVDEVKACSEKVLGRRLDRKFVRRSMALLNNVDWIDPRLGVVTVRPDKTRNRESEALLRPSDPCTKLDSCA